jgi:hypothetical protein
MTQMAELPARSPRNGPAKPDQPGKPQNDPEAGGPAKPPSPPPVTFTEIQAAEREIIRQQRARRGVEPDPDRTIGLALSGGGIRSASFALGVLQALEREGVLRDVDYLSTVSGGGYIGSSLTWFNYLGRGSSRTFPFGHKGQVLREVSGRKGASPADNTAFVRQHGEYLTPSRAISLASMIALVLRVAFVTFSVYFALLLAAVLLVAKYYGELKIGPFAPAWCLFALCAVGSVVFALLTGPLPKIRPDNRFLYRERIRGQRFLGRCFVLASMALVAALVAVTPTLVGPAVLKGWHWAIGLGPTLTGIAGTAWEFLKQREPRLQVASPKLNALVTWIAGAALVYGLLVLADVAAAHILDAVKGQAASRQFWIWTGCLIGGSVIVGGLINSNLFGLHRMYRDRLMETFLPDAAAVKERRWQPAFEADSCFLKDVCTGLDWGPYHLINANVILTDSNYAYYRGRGGDNFIFSSQFCGSEATGWLPTGKFCGGSMSLATAMAISGAAINPDAACGGQGATRNPLASFMLSLFGVRLGYWVPNPQPTRPLGRLLGKVWPNLLIPGLRQGLFGVGLDRRARFVELTDGGHFDNTGLYELIRRRVDCIVLSLASADEEYGFDDLADVVERVRVDFGVFIDFPDNFKQSIPDAAIPAAGIASGLRLCAQSYCAGEIAYPQVGNASAKKGNLVVLKAALVTDLPADVLRYAVGHRDFPNESTVDQFFDERQFEAYRETGYAACRDMLKVHWHGHCGKRNPLGSARAERVT